MSFVKTVVVGSCILFGAIGVAAYVKKSGASESQPDVVAIEWESDVAAYQEAEPAPAVELRDDVELPEGDRMELFFNTAWPKLPIVQTVAYSSRVDWLDGRPAWVADYASHFKTSRHFIARSLNQDLDYFSQKVSNGDRFNVLRTDVELEFYLVVDLNRCKMWAYYIDTESDERVLMKSYDVGVGRSDSKKASGWLTPLGKYTLGSKIAVYRPGTMGLYNNDKIEMMRVFGTRWIPFDEELRGCTAPARGLGIHGCPWVEVEGELVEDTSGLGDHSSDGCIRLRTEEMEELFSIIITRPVTIELVGDFFQASLPGTEVEPNCLMMEEK